MSSKRQSQRLRLEPTRYIHSVADDRMHNPSCSLKTTRKRRTSVSVQHDIDDEHELITLETLLEIPTNDIPEVLPTSWRKAYDPQIYAIVFYQLDLSSNIPTISKSVRIEPVSVSPQQASSVDVEAARETRLLPSVLIGGHELPSHDSVVESVIGERYIGSVDDVPKLLDFLSTIPAQPAAESGESTLQMMPDSMKQLKSYKGSQGVRTEVYRRPPRKKKKRADDVANVDPAMSSSPDAIHNGGFYGESGDFYWQHPGENRTVLHEGYDIYVLTPVLEDLQTSALASVSPSAWKSYAWNLTLHLLGDTEGIGKLKAHRKSTDETRNFSIDSILDEGTVHGILAHVRDIFQLDDSSLVDAYKQWCDGILMQIHPHPCFEANRRDEGYGKETGKRRSRNPTGTGKTTPSSADQNTSAASHEGAMQPKSAKKLKVVGSLLGKPMCPVKKCAARRYAAADLRFLRRHFEQVHVLEYPNCVFELVCPVAGCAKVVGDTMDLLRQHVFEEHDHLIPYRCTEENSALSTPVNDALGVKSQEALPLPMMLVDVGLGRVSDVL